MAKVAAPVSSTGVQMTSGAALGLGWLQGTIREVDRARLVERLVAWFGDAREAAAFGWYRESLRLGPDGVVVAWGPKGRNPHPGEVFVSVPQSALDRLGWSRGLILLDWLVSDEGLRPSRLDVYADDHARLADPSDVLAALEAGNARTHVETWRTVRDSSGGMTTYIGSRTGECMVRVYRKWAESGNPQDGVRWEMEAKGPRAVAVAGLLLVADDPAGTWVGLLRYFVDFVDMEGQSRADRAPLLGWWAAFVEGVGRAGVRLGRLADDLARKRRWVASQVAPTLAVLFAVDGAEWLSGVMAEAWSRGPWHLARGMTPHAGKGAGAVAYA